MTLSPPHRMVTAVGIKDFQISKGTMELNSLQDGLLGAFHTCFNLVQLPLGQHQRGAGETTDQSPCPTKWQFLEKLCTLRYYCTKFLKLLECLPWERHVTYLIPTFYASQIPTASLSSLTLRILKHQWSNGSVSLWLLKPIY